MSGEATGREPGENSAGTILLVEDDAAVRRVLRRMLSNRGYSIIEAGSAPEAIQAAASHSGTIDLLITDVVMPRTNCDQLVHDLQAARPNLKCILISGYPQDMLSEHGLAGARPDFMQKPFTAEQLVAKIREVLGIQVRRCGGESA